MKRSLVRVCLNTPPTLTDPSLAEHARCVVASSKPGYKTSQTPRLKVPGCVNKDNTAHTTPSTRRTPRVEDRPLPTERGTFSKVTGSDYHRDGPNTFIHRSYHTLLSMHPRSFHSTNDTQVSACLYRRTRVANLYDYLVAPTTPPSHCSNAQARRKNHLHRHPRYLHIRRQIVQQKICEVTKVSTSDDQYHSP